MIKKPHLFLTVATSVLCLTTGLADDPGKSAEDPNRVSPEASAPPKVGPRDGDTPKTGPRDGEGAPKTGPRDGEGGPKTGPRDGAGVKLDDRKLKQLTRIHKAYDKDGNKTVSLEEWLAMKDGDMTPDRRSREKKWYDQADENRDEKLTVEEWIKWKASQGQRREG